MATSLSSSGEAGFEASARGVHLAHRVLHGDELLAAGLHVPFGAAEGRQDQRRAAADGVRAVELGGDVGGERAGSHGLLGDHAVGRGADEVAREGEEELDAALEHRADGVHGVESVVAGRVEAELLLQGVEEGVGHLLPDAHGAVALHIAVSAHGAGSGARPAQIAAQHEEVDELADGGHRVLVLGDAHRPADDDAFGAQHLVADLLDLLAGEAGRGEDVVPVDGADVPGERLEALGVVADVVVVEDGAGAGVLGLQEQPVEALEQGEVATDADLQEAVGDGGAAADDAARLLRVLEAQQPGLGQRVHGDDAGAVALGLLQGGELAGVVGAGVLPHDEDEIGVVHVLQADRALAGAEGLVEGVTAGLVAQVAAVRQVVGAEGAGEQLEHEGGFVAGAARGVESGLVGRVQGGEFLGEQSERVVPADRFVVVGVGPLDHGFGEAGPGR